MKKLAPLLLLLASTLSYSAQEDDARFIELVKSTKFNHSETLSDYKPYACSGYPYAQYVVSNLYTADNEVALSEFWLREAAKRGQERAVLRISAQASNSDESYQWFYFYYKNYMQQPDILGIEQQRAEWMQKIPESHRLSLEQDVSAWPILRDVPVVPCN